MTDEPGLPPEIEPALTRQERLAAILRGEKPSKAGKKGVSDQRKQDTQRDIAQRDSMKKSVRGPRKRG